MAHAQSSLGNGIAYVSLLLLAYERMRSPWAIGVVLLADYCRRWCSVPYSARSATAGRGAAA